MCIFENIYGVEYIKCPENYKDYGIKCPFYGYDICKYHFTQEKMDFYKMIAEIASSATIMKLLEDDGK